MMVSTAWSLTSSPSLSNGRTTNESRGRSVAAALGGAGVAVCPIWDEEVRGRYQMAAIVRAATARHETATQPRGQRHGLAGGRIVGPCSPCAAGGASACFGSVSEASAVSATLLGARSSSVGVLLVREPGSGPTGGTKR